MSPECRDGLHAIRLGLRDDAGEKAMAWALGAVEGAHIGGALTDDERELWRRRMGECPGHDDEGGRVWCAFCGDLPVRGEP